MKPYGVKRSWNNDILVKNGVAQRTSTHTKWKKLMHRKARRVSKYQLKGETMNDEFHLTVKKLHDILGKLIAQGHGDAIVYHSDGRSGIDEEADAHETIEENAEMASGEVLKKGFPVYFW